MTSVNYEITDKVVYKTTQYQIEGDDGNVYLIKCSEDDFMDYWSIWNDEDGDIEPESDLGRELINLCMREEEEK